MIKASKFTNTDELLECLKTLPRKPQKTKTETGYRISMSITPDKIWNITQPWLNLINEFLTENRLSIAWDWRYWIDSDDMELTHLLILEDPNQTDIFTKRPETDILK